MTMRSRSTMRMTTLALAIAAGACAVYRGPGQNRITFNTHLSPDSVMTIAQAELGRRGFQFTRQNVNTLTTEARTIAPGVATDSAGNRISYWVMRVDAVPSPLASGTDVRVYGYAFPVVRGADSTNAANASMVSAANDKLFGQIRDFGVKLQDLTR
jgi:hypothetical protein